MKQHLMNVYVDTLVTAELEYNEKLIQAKKYTSMFKPLNGNLKANITVNNIDCIIEAEKFSRHKGKTCMLNMASYKRPGGGVANGAMAQEEELCRRSNLMHGISDKHYPLKPNEYIYTKDVTFFKDENYLRIPEFKCDIITLPAVNKNTGPLKDYDSVMESKVRTMLYEPYQNGCKNLVLSAFGCGVYGNDPVYVATLFKKLLDEGFSTMYENISFAILNDRNAVGDNYNIFKTILR